MITMIEKLKELKIELDNQRNIIKEQFYSLFDEVWKNTNIISFSWVQYTDIFPDEKLRKFCINYIQFNGKPDSELDFDVSNERKYIINILTQFDVDDLKYMFDDGRIEVYRDYLISY